MSGDFPIASKKGKQQNQTPTVSAVISFTYTAAAMDCFVAH